MIQNKSLKDSVIVITGASSGFGKGVAQKFADVGAKLVLAARREDLLNELVQDCISRGAQAVSVPTDVAKADEVENLAQAAISQFGSIDIWINDAGVGALGRFEEIPLADHVQVIEINLLGALYGSYFAMKQFRYQLTGTLINIASVLGKIPSPYYASYTAAKHGVVGLSATLRQELAENGMENIHVCTVLPMSNDTPFFDHVANYTGHEPVPIPPLYDPEKVIDTIFELATEPADEVVVGVTGKAMVAAHGMASGIVEKMMGHEAHKEQMEKAPLAVNSPGSVQQPSPYGTNVRGGRLKS